MANLVGPIAVFLKEQKKEQKPWKTSILGQTNQTTGDASACIAGGFAQLMTAQAQIVRIGVHLCVWGKKVGD